MIYKHQIKTGSVHMPSRWHW